MQNILILGNQPWTNQILKQLQQFFDDLNFKLIDQGFTGLIEVEQILLKGLSYDLILVDDALPLLNGFAWIEALRSIEKGLLKKPTPVLLLSVKEGDEGFLAANPQTLHLKLLQNADDPFLVQAAVLQILARLAQMRGEQV
jgi:CheY-like chemotaxis protein